MIGDHDDSDATVIGGSTNRGRRTGSAVAVTAIVFLVALFMATPFAGAIGAMGRDGETDSVDSTNRPGQVEQTSTSEYHVASSMTPLKAAILGVVEGVTEYLPISSTGHLVITSDLLGLGTSEEQIQAANTYAIAIQFGAILAVAGLFWKRFRDMVLGLFGRSEEGRHLLIVLVVAFLPAAVLGFLFDDMIEERLFSSWPIIGAWFVGGLAILWLERSGRISRDTPDAAIDADDAGNAGTAGAASKLSAVTDPIMAITVRQAVIIGFIQCIAMWPGTSRSLAAILGALLVGVGMAAAVEFSFLLGFVTLTAASVFSLLKDGDNLIEQFGVVDPLIGLFFAFIAAVAAIKWMISYLQSHDLSIFGWYRIAIAGVASVLVLAGTLTF